MNDGWSKFDGDIIHSLAFMQGLRFLAFGLTTNRYPELRREISRAGSELELPAGEEFELMRVGQRRVVLRALSRWLKQWPRCILKDIENSRTYLSTFRLSRVAPPFWVAKALDEHPSAQTREVSRAEVEAAVRWLRSNAMGLTKSSLKDSLGLGSSHKLDGHLQRLLNDACLAEKG